MTRDNRPVRVVCSTCRGEFRSNEALEVVILLTRRAGGSLGGVEHLTPVGVWVCRSCSRLSPFDVSVLTRLREQLSRAPPAEQRSLLA